MKKLALFIFCLLFLNLYKVNCQDDKSVLFIGNSYTFIHDIPNMVLQAANSTNDMLIVDTQTAGSATFEFHANSSDVADKINSYDWNYVVLQGGSIEVAITGDYFNNNVAPFVADLVQKISNNNECTQPVFYRTWGRKWGYSGSTCTMYPSTCTYEDMDDALAQNYDILAENNEGIISPVGQVWRYIRDTLVPVDLYGEDESHQSIAGAYAAACTFYATLLRKDPTLITYNPGLSQSVASQIRNAAKVVVFDELENWNIGAFDPFADFNYNNTNSEVFFTNNSINADSYLWNFGDGFTSTNRNPVHNYTQTGSYNISLTATKCGINNSLQKSIHIATLNLEILTPFNINIYPNPVSTSLFIENIENIQITTIEIFDSLGNVIKKLNSLESNSVHIGDFASGLYIIRIMNSNNQQLIKKFIKI